MTSLTLKDFQNLFAPNIRAMLNWDLLLTENAKVGTVVINDHSDLASLFTVWHVNSDGAFADWDDPDARPLTIGDSVNSRRNWSEERTYNVSKFQSEFALSDEPVNLLLPVYAAGEGYVLLDGTHRTVAVHNDNFPFSAMLVVLHGPVSDQILPDLRWHERERMTAQESEALSAS